MATLAVLVATDRATIWLCYAMAFLLGTGETLFDNATLGIVFVFGAFGGLIWNVLTIAIRQERIPDELLGAVVLAVGAAFTWPRLTLT